MNKIVMAADIFIHSILLPFLSDGSVGAIIAKMI